MTGQTISHYRVLSKLGEGGMGVVYKAEDTRLQRTVALKLLAPHLASDPEQKTRFLREGQAAASIHHPNVCTIFEVDEDHAFLAMEFVDGPSLKEKIAERPLPLEEALDIAIQACQGLLAAHEKGVTHRDIKPANIMLTAKGQVKIMDFGLAQIGHRSRITKTGSTLGTPAYMSPEQAQGAPTDRRTDIWSLAVVVYEMITGRLPFRGDTEPAIAYAVVHQEAEPLTALRSGIPLELDRITAKALRKDPGSRYAHLDDLLVDLEQLRLPPSPMVRRRGLLFAAAGLVSLLVAGAGLYYWLRPLRIPAPAEFQQITYFNDSVTSPALSPDGRLLTFIRGQNTFFGPGQIYVKLLPDGEPVRLTNDSSIKVAPAFSPDGARVIYSVVLNMWSWGSWSVPVLGGEPKLWLPNASGLVWIGPRQILFSEIKGGIYMGLVTAEESRANSRDVYFPKHHRGMAHRSYLSPDRKWVLFSEMDNLGWLPCRLVPFDGSSEGRTVGPPGRCFDGAWSPDGRWMYFTSDLSGTNQLWRQRFPNGSPQQFTFGPTEAAGIAMDPDGKSLVTSIGFDQSAIWIHDTSGDRPLTQQGFAMLPSFGDGFPRSIFSPDGKRLYYLVRSPKGRGFSSGELWSAETATGVTEPALPGLYISSYDISHDGKRVTFAAIDPDGAYRIWVAGLDRRSPPRQLPPVNAIGPVFSPSGEIYFRADEAGHNHIFAIRKDGGGMRKISDEVAINAPMISPDGAWVVATLESTGDNNSTITGDNNSSITKAFPTRGGAPVTLCGWCIVKWSRDGKSMFVSYGNANDVGDNFVIGLAPGKMLPDKMEGNPGTGAIHEAMVFPGIDSSTYAFRRRTVQRNLYRIRLD